MEVNETRNCLVTDILLNIRKSSEWIRKRYFILFPKRVEYPFKRKKDMDIVDDIGVSKISAKVFLKKWTTPLISANTLFRFSPTLQLRQLILTLTLQTTTSLH